MAEFRTWSIALLCAALLSGCATPSVTAWMSVGVRKGREFPISAAPGGKGWGYVSHPHVYILGSNAWVMVAYGEIGKAGYAERFSADQGATWTPHPGWLTNALNSIRLSAYLRDGKRLIFESVGARGITRALEIADDPERGEPFEARFGDTGGYTFYLQPHAVEMPDGSILAPCYGKKSQKEKKYTSYLMRSTDRGRTFAFGGVIAGPDDTPWGNEGPCEPALVDFPDGSLLCVARTGSRSEPNGLGVSLPMISCRSRDGGRTWTREKMIVSGVQPKLLRLHDGGLLLAYGRPGNNLVFSVDGGETWGKEINLSMPDEPTTGYCDVAWIGEDRYLAVYDKMSWRSSAVWLWEPPAPQQAVLGQILRVEGGGGKTP